MPEVPNDGARLTSEAATVTDTIGSTSVFVQVGHVQLDPVEAELVGMPTGPVAVG